MITHGDITGVSESTARRILVLARSIAPCLDTLDGDARQDAVAILQGVAADVVTRGSRAVKSQRVGPASVEYVVSASSFSDEDRAALRSLCSLTSTAALPMGSFPSDRPLSRMWPEGTYS